MTIDEEIEIEGDITIDGNNHFVDGNNHSLIFKINSGDVTIKNLYFKNGNSNFGGAIYNDFAHVMFINCRFESNSAQNGGAIYNEKGSVELKSCEFTGNAAENDGGAIYSETGFLSLEQSKFIQNSASCGGAIFSIFDIRLKECVFEKNESLDEGGAVYGTGQFRNSIFKENSSQSGGGAMFGRGFFDRIIFEKNSSKQGGALKISQGNKIQNCRFIDNYASDSGRSIKLFSSSSLIRSTPKHLQHDIKHALLSSYERDYIKILKSYFLDDLSDDSSRGGVISNYSGYLDVLNCEFKGKYEKVIITRLGIDVNECSMENHHKIVNEQGTLKDLNISYIGLE